MSLLAKLEFAGIGASKARGLTVMSCAAGIPPTASALAALGTVPSSASLMRVPPSESFLISCGPSVAFLMSSPVRELLATFAPVTFRAA